ncbi:MAG: EamA/RhaT family transporter [Coriobacteriaceae bacterium]|nr:EamA/RhaT family transporter [Coriobacteriaceae bacterium]
MERQKSQIIGYAFAVLQAVLYSTMGIFGKLLYATGMDSQQAVLLRFLCSTVLLGVFMLVWRKEKLVSRQKTVYLQAVFYFASAFLYFFAVERMNAGITTVFFYLYPAMVAAINLAVFHERLSVAVAVALILSIMGLVLISGVTSGELTLDPLGLVFALASALAFAIYTVLIQVTGRTEGSFTVTFTLSWTSLLASCIVFAPSVPAMLHLSAYQIAVGCTMALANTILPVVLYIQAVKHIGGTKTSLIGISETPFSLLFAFLILGETIAPVEGLGILLIVGGIAVITVAPMLQKKK